MMDDAPPFFTIGSFGTKAQLNGFEPCTFQFYELLTLNEANLIVDNAWKDYQNNFSPFSFIPPLHTPEYRLAGISAPCRSGLKC